MKRAFATVLSSIVLAVVALVIAPAGAAAASPGEEQAFVTRINALRAANGLAPLQVDGELTGIARSWAEQMAAAGGISHSPGLGSGVSAPWVLMGENVGVGGDVDSLFDAFVASPSHYANLVEPSFTHVGVGVIWADGRMWTTHQFMALESAPPPPPPPAGDAQPVVLAGAEPASGAPAEASAPAAPAPAAVPAPPAEPARVAAVLEALRSFG